MLVPPESSSAVLLMISSKSATVLTLDELIVAKYRFLRGGVPLFDALVREESPHPAARNLLARN